MIPVRLSVFFFPLASVPAFCTVMAGRDAIAFRYAIVLTSASTVFFSMTAAAAPPFEALGFSSTPAVTILFSESSTAVTAMDPSAVTLVAAVAAESSDVVGPRPLFTPTTVRTMFLLFAPAARPISPLPSVPVTGSSTMSIFSSRVESSQTLPPAVTVEPSPRSVLTSLAASKKTATPVGLNAYLLSETGSTATR